MYQDSNFVGNFAAVLFFYVVYLAQNYELNLKKQKIVLAILTVLTISRGVIITLVLFTFLFDVKNKRNFKVILPFILSIGIAVVWIIFADDGSFISKFRIVEYTITYLKNADLSTIMFGCGLGNAVNSIGIGAHMYFISCIIETGLLGLLLFFLFLLNCIKKCKKQYYIIFPFVFLGFSLMPHFIPYFMCELALIEKMEDEIQL